MHEFRLHLVFALISFASVIALAPASAQEQSEQTKARVGVFDSRAVGLAYGRSELFKEKLSNLKERHAAAKKSGDEERVKELEAEGQAMQDLLHKQVFGSYPISEILETIKDKLPGIVEEAGVIALVSQWGVVHKTASFRTVDLTLPLVKLFNPSEATLKMIEEIKDTEPVPLDELNHEH